jgi:2-oxoglutarate ferredoxin oxidoreductase subunit alpha
MRSPMGSPRATETWSRERGRLVNRSIFVVGAAGEGIQTIGDVVARCYLAHGYPVFATQEFESRIRGGNSSYRIRVADEPLNAPSEEADVLLALNPIAGEYYAESLRSGGLLLSSDDTAAGLTVPFLSLATEHGGKAIYANTVAAGTLCAAVGLPFAVLDRVLSSAFATRGEDVVRANAAAARAGFDLATTLLGDGRAEDLPKRKKAYAFASAHEAIPLAAAAAGCRFISAYPMSPSTGIITTFAQDADLGVFAEQAEDEISAINMALGASAAGARAMTATSGGGFALMVEGLSLSGMIETPIVIVLAQRPGPATGLPTRTAQEDLLFAIRAGHGEFPRVVLAPSDPQEAIDLTIRAFDLADRYQAPAILLTDQYLADSRFSLETLDLPAEISTVHLADPRDFETYARYAPTESGISPRLAFGQGGHTVTLDSDEHTPEGHITEDLRTVRPTAVEKRREKARRLRSEIRSPKPDRVDDAELIFVGWGSTKGAIAEAVDQLRATGRKVGAIHFAELWPMPEVRHRENARYWTVEGNATGQLAHLLRGELGWPIDGTIGRSDGLPIDARFILKRTP